MAKVYKKTFQYGAHTVTLETGAIARQASGSVLVSMGDTMVLVAVVAKKEASTTHDFFPLTVHYQERYYSAGRMPGGFIKRESRPSTQEVLISRLIDRPIRPLFPEGFRNEVQIVATVMSMDPEICGDVPAIIGASAALAIAGIPCTHVLAAARVGYADGHYLLNPTAKHLETSLLELVVAGTDEAVLMVESAAKELPEAVMLGAVMYGHAEMQVAINAIKELAAEVGNPKWELQLPVFNQALYDSIKTSFGAQIIDCYRVYDKKERQDKVAAVRAEALKQFAPNAANENLTAEDKALAKEVTKLFAKLEESTVRGHIVKDKIRIDGRDLKTIRPISMEVGAFPRAHGSANFTRGETQALVFTTLATDQDAQTIDIPAGESSERFMLHYNFPPYCTGETGMMGSPKRREIGHGNLAKRSLLAVMPTKEEFPYVIRVVSEITESNGSSSMASVCGGTLSMMDAGIPLKAPVAGVAMGLIKEGDSFAVLTDILGDEDHFGDMDFKVAGTVRGITALQMDIKISGITEEIMKVALEQAHEGRIFILDLILDKLPRPREHVSDFAPRIYHIKISTDKIRDVIGKGGVTIRALVEETGTQIDISDDGVVTIAGVDKSACDEAIRRIEALTAVPEIGKIYTGKVVKIMEFGAFVNIMPGTDGLVHVSQIANKRVEHVDDYLKEGQVVNVKVLEVDRQGKIRLSMKEAEADMVAKT